MGNLTIILRGGFGNQLFQLLVTNNLAKISHMRHCYYDGFINKDKYKRKLEVSEVSNLLSIYKSYDLDNQLYFNEMDLMNPLFYTDHSPLISINNKNIVVDGYFQNYRLFDNSSIYRIKNFLRISSDKLINIPEKYISIHLRELHGDGEILNYIKYDSLSFDYYSKALNEIFKIESNRVANIKLLVFMDFWKEPFNSKLLPQIRSLSEKLGFQIILADSFCSNPLDIVRLMSNSNYVITANSTLSWFGAFFSNAKVFSPIISMWDPILTVPDSWEQIYDGNPLPRIHAPINKSFCSTNKLYNYSKMKPFSKQIYLISRYYFFRKIINRIKNYFLRFTNKNHKNSILF